MLNYVYRALQLDKIETGETPQAATETIGFNCL